MHPNTIVEEALKLTKRPDKEDLAFQKLNKAMRKLSTSAELAQDLQEFVHYFTEPTEIVQELPLSIFTKFRKICYLLPVGYKRPLQLITPDAIFDINCREAFDVYYVSGDKVRINLSVPQPAIKVGYFSYPPTITKTTNWQQSVGPEEFVEVYPWLCNIAEYVLIDLVAADILRSIGDDTSAQAHEADARLSWESLKQDIKWGGLP